MTNFSLMPKEMLACGLPCVELAGVSAESIFGVDGPIELGELDPIAIADALERLLDDRELRERRSREGIEFVASHTWEHATDEVEAGLRHALRLREQAWVARRLRDLDRHSGQERRGGSRRAAWRRSHPRSWIGDEPVELVVVDSGST